MNRQGKYAIAVWYALNYEKYANSWKTVEKLRANKLLLPFPYRERGINPDYDCTATSELPCRFQRILITGSLNNRANRRENKKKETASGKQSQPDSLVVRELVKPRYAPEIPLSSRK